MSESKYNKRCVRCSRRIPRVKTSAYQKQLIYEIQTIPEEYLPNLIQIIRLSNDSVTLKPAAEAAQGWKEAQSGMTKPVSELWMDHVKRIDKRQIEFSLSLRNLRALKNTATFNRTFNLSLINCKQAS